VKRSILEAMVDQDVSMPILGSQFPSVSTATKWRDLTTPRIFTSCTQVQSTEVMMKKYRSEDEVRADMAIGEGKLPCIRPDQCQPICITMGWNPTTMK